MRTIPFSVFVILAGGALVCGGEESIEIQGAVELIVTADPEKEYILQYSDDAEEWISGEWITGTVEEQRFLRSTSNSLQRFWRLREKGSPPVQNELLDGQVMTGSEPLTFMLPSHAFVDPDGHDLQYSFSTGPSVAGSLRDPLWFQFNPQTFEVVANPGTGFTGAGVHRVKVTVSDQVDGSVEAGFDMVVLEPGLADAWRDAYQVYDHWGGRLEEFSGSNGISLRIDGGGAPVIYLHVNDEGVQVPPELEFNGYHVPVQSEYHNPQHLSLAAGDNVNGDQNFASLGTLTYPFKRIEDGETVVLTNLHVAAQLRLKTGIGLDAFPADVATATGIPVYVHESGGKVRFGKVDRFDGNFWTSLLAEARSQGNPVSPIYDGATVEPDDGRDVSWLLPASPLLAEDRRCPRAPVHRWNMSGPAVAAMVRQQRALLKFGTVTGTTKGYLSGIARSRVGIEVGGTSFSLDYGDYLLVGEATDPVEISAKGDSGSLVIFEDSLQPCGLLFGANIKDPVTGGASQYYMQPVQPVLDSLEIRFDPECPPANLSRRYLYYTCPLNRTTLCGGGSMFPRADTATSPVDPLLPFKNAISSSASGAFLIDDPLRNLSQVELLLTDSFGNSVEISPSSNSGFIKAPNTHRVGSDGNRTLYKDAWAVVLDGGWLLSAGLRVEPGAAGWEAVLTVSSGGSQEVLRVSLRISN